MKDKGNLLILILIIFYTVGVIGLIIPDTRNFFISLSPFNLMLTVVLYIWSNGDYRFHFFLTAFIVFICGWTIEWAGVHTGVLFGEYNYGQGLGFKLRGIPLIIGVNWLILCLASRAIFKKFFSSPWLISIFSSILMCILDFLIEPIAIKFDFWHWKNNIIPIQNYVMWFISSLMLQMIIQKSDIKLAFKPGLTVFLVQIAFFVVLNFFIL
jgi:putative membrane protein